MLKKFYSSTKTLFALLGGVLIVIQIYKLSTESRSGLYSTYYIHQFKIPHKFDSISHASASKHLRLYIDSLLISTSGKTKGAVSSTSNEKNISGDFLYDFFSEHSNKCDLFIRNSGDKEIQNIKVNYQGSFYYEYQDNEGKYVAGEAKESFSLSSLRPTEYLLITIWALNSDLNMKITYPDGAIQPSMSYNVFGFLGLIGNFLNESVWIDSFLLLLLTYGLFIFYKWAYKRGVKSPKPTSKSTQKALNPL